MTEEMAQFIKAGTPAPTGTQGTITTGDVTFGLLNPEQADTFLTRVFDKIVLSSMVRHEKRRVTSGSIDKIGIEEGIIRPFIENDPDDYNAVPTFGAVPYHTTEWWLPWSITRQTLDENIEGSGFEATVEDLMTSAMAHDIERAAVNGDKDKTTGPFHKILQVDDGWIKQIKEGGHVLDGGAHASLSLDLWGEILQSLPSRYVSNDLTWLVNPRVATQWALYLASSAVTAGGIVGDAFVKNPCGLPMIPVPSMPEDTIILTRPKNLILVHTLDVSIEKTAVGVTALRHKAIYYVSRFNMDYIIEEVDACAMMQGIPSTIFSHGVGTKAAAGSSTKKS